MNACPTASGAMNKLFILLLLTVSCFAQEPPLPPISTNSPPPKSIIMRGASVLSAFDTPGGLEIIDMRFTNWIADVTLGWNLNPEPEVQGYRLYWGAASRFYTNFIRFGNTNQGTVPGIARTNRNYFALTAINSAGIESDFSDELAWPNPVLPPYYTNFAVLLPYDFSTNANGPWLTYTARLHYVSQTNGPMYWRSRPLQIERAP